MQLGPKALAGALITPAVTVAVQPRLIIAVGVIVGIVIVIVIWHLRRGGIVSLRRTPKGHLSLTLRSTSRRRR